MTTDQRVAVVTGGGGGIGAAIAEELGRCGAFVVTADPLVSLDGSEQLPQPEETTAGRIIAAGGSARATSVSVTDRDAVRDLFHGLVDELGRLDVVVNVAGITRPTGFVKGSEHDWRQVLSVHLDGYRNVLEAALPVMATAGRGRILGVTSGSGWRPSDTGAYGCAKRAVAALTRQLGRQAPPGVTVNAISPIAVTRMVTAALDRARQAAASGDGSSVSGGLSLASMPTPEQVAPLAAHLVGGGLSWCSGHVVFAGGSEAAVIEPPGLLEVVRGDDAASLALILEAVTPGALVPAEARQLSGGGANPRFGNIFDPSAEGALPLPPSASASCVVVADLPHVAAAVTAALQERGVACTTVDAGRVAPGFDGAAAALAAASERVGPPDAVVVALAGDGPAAGAVDGWQRVLAEHSGIVDRILADAGWWRAAGDHATAAARPVRVVTLVDATTAGGRSRAEAAAQHARSARGATGDLVTAVAVGVEGPLSEHPGPVAALVGHLVCSPDAGALSGAELVAADGWIGLRSHPRPSASITFGGPAVPSWFDLALRDIVGPAARAEELR